MVLHVSLMIICGKVMCIVLLSLMSNIRIYVQYIFRAKQSLKSSRNKLGTNKTKDLCEEKGICWRQNKDYVGGATS